MKLRLTIALGALAFLPALFAVSCSSNNNGTTMIAIDDGDENSVETKKDSATNELTLDYYRSRQNRNDNIATDRPTEPQTIESNASTNASATLESRFKFSEPRALFNGRDLNGWVGPTGDAPKGWVVQSQALCLTDPENGEDILTQESFQDYVLTFEWRFGRECNSGVKYKIQSNGKSWGGLEYQIQDDANVEDGKIAKRTIASLFDVLPAKKSSKAEEFPEPQNKEPCGEFRRGKIVVVGSQVEHWIDDELVLAFTIGDPEWTNAKNESKFKNSKNFGLTQNSPILFQAHGSPVEFKEIAIQTLEK